MHPVLKCALCELPTMKLICNTCYNELEIITNKQCISCGKPCVDNYCHQCITKKPFFDYAYSKFIYASPLDKMLHQLKYKKNNRLVWILGYLFNQSMLEVTKKHHIDIVIPMPISKKRRQERGFNQVDIMLKYYQTKSYSLPIKQNIVEKLIDTPHQTTISKEERLYLELASSNIFKVKKNVRGKTILIADDVITTGATANALAMALKNAGARQVILCTLMRTI